MEIRSEPGPLGGPVTDQGLELRAMPMGEFKDMDEGKREVQVVFPHETVDSYRTVFAPGAFEDGWRQSLPLVCWQHDLKEPIGRVISAQSLHGRDEIIEHFDDPEFVPRAGQALAQIKSRTLTDQSFGFKNARYQNAKEMGKGVRRIVSAFQAEVSPVSIGSIPGAKAVALREDEGEAVAEEVIEMGQLLHMRDSGLITAQTFATLVIRNHPELANDPIIVRDLQGDDEDADDPSGAAAENEVDPFRWDATDAGVHTATGPNDESLAVAPTQEDLSHVWVVLDSDGNELASGQEANVDAAKQKAESSVRQRSDEDMETFEAAEVIDADMVRELIEMERPHWAAALEGATITLGMAGEERSEALSPHAAALAAILDAGLDNAVRWLDGVDVAELPDEVQQGVALLISSRAAAEQLAAELGVEVPGAEERDDEEELEARAAAAGFSTKPWSDFDQSDYSPEQWKGACLICEGDGSTKDQCSLPYKEPDGTPNVNGIAAAAGRLNQTEASDADKQAAAKTLLGLYGKMKKPAPPNVLKIAGSETRSDEEIAADAEEEAELLAEEAEKMEKLGRIPAAV